MKVIWCATILAALTWGSVLPVRADQVVLQNGDRINGTVLSVSTNAVVFKSESFGSVTFPRAEVTAILFGNWAASSPRLVLPGVGAPGRSSFRAGTNSPSDLSAALRGIRGQTNLIRQVQDQLLSSGNPEAVSKFNEILDDLSTGKIDLNGLRRQAQTAATQLRSLKKDLGPDYSGELDGYLSILDGFLRDTAPTAVATNSSGRLSKTNAMRKRSIR